MYQLLAEEGIRHGGRAQKLLKNQADLLVLTPAFA